MRGGIPAVLAMRYEITDAAAVEFARTFSNEPLAAIVLPEDAPQLDALVAARRWEIYRDAFEDAAHFDSYIDATSGHLAWIAARRLGAPEAAEPAVRDLAYAAGVAGFLRAVPELEARGRVPLLDGRPDAVRALAQKALARHVKGRAGQGAVPKPARAALYAFWQAQALLRAVVKEPSRVAEGRLARSEFNRRAGLLLVSLRGRL